MAVRRRSTRSLATAALLVRRKQFTLPVAGAKGGEMVFATGRSIFSYAARSCSRPLLDLAGRPRHVHYRGYSGQHSLNLSFTAFDPHRTFLRNSDCQLIASTPVDMGQ